MTPIIEVQQISKKFRIGQQVEPYLSLRSRLAYFYRASVKQEDFWALRDITFSVDPGESLAIIGKNGAGKSTLLKILSRITPPTTGRILGRGRVACLLEVGTGFHPELTGRENIFLNGSILGMKRKEIEKQFDAIVDFSGTEKFLETQLKHFSSGMQLRLAFSVAAFLEPEILVIDEVLAVGDAEFQNKCMRKMEDVSRGGRTILFVSHNMTAVQKLCKKAILLNQGKVETIGGVTEVIDQYLNHSNDAEGHPSAWLPQARTGNGTVRFTAIRVEPVGDFIEPTRGVKFHVDLTGQPDMPSAPIYLAITVYDHQHTKLFTLDNLYTNQPIVSQPGEFSVTCQIDALHLVPGTYYISLWCANHFETFDTVEDAASFSVTESDVYKTGKMHASSLHGNFLVSNVWKNQ